MTQRPRGSAAGRRTLLRHQRRTAGVDGSGAPLRLGERDSDDHIVGYIDDAGLAWESLHERIVAIRGEQLADALSSTSPDSDRRVDELLAGLPG